MKGALGEFIDLSHSINMQIANHCCTLLGDFEMLVQTSNSQDTRQVADF